MIAGPRDLGGNARGDVLGKCCGQCGPRDADTSASTNDLPTAVDKLCAAADAQAPDPIWLDIERELRSCIDSGTSPALDELDCRRLLDLMRGHGIGAPAQAEPVAPFWRAIVSKSHPFLDRAIRRADVAQEYADKARVNYPGADIEVVPLYTAPAAQPQPVNAQMRDALERLIQDGDVRDAASAGALRKARAALAAADAAPKPLDDPRLQDLFSCAISGALGLGAEGVQPPPAGHWLESWWQRGRAIAGVAPVALTDEQLLGLIPTGGVRGPIDALWFARAVERAHGITAGQAGKGD